MNEFHFKIGYVYQTKIGTPFLIIVDLRRWQEDTIWCFGAITFRPDEQDSRLKFVQIKGDFNTPYKGEHRCVEWFDQDGKGKGLPFKMDKYDLDFSTEIIFEEWLANVKRERKREEERWSSGY